MRIKSAAKVLIFCQAEKFRRVLFVKFNIKATLMKLFVAKFLAFNSNRSQLNAKFHNSLAQHSLGHEFL